MVTGSDRNPYQATISTFLSALKKRLGKYLVWGGRDGASRFASTKKKLVSEETDTGITDTGFKVELFLKSCFREKNLKRTSGKN